MATWRRRPEPVIPLCPFLDPDRWAECNGWLALLAADVQHVVLTRCLRGECHG
jgi:hypothetical protein